MSTNMQQFDLFDLGHTLAEEVPRLTPSENDLKNEIRRVLEDNGVLQIDVREDREKLLQKIVAAIDEWTEALAYGEE